MLAVMWFGFEFAIGVMLALVLVPLAIVLLWACGKLVINLFQTRIVTALLGLTVIGLWLGWVFSH